MKGHVFRLYELREGGRLVPLAEGHVFENEDVARKVADDMNEHRHAVKGPQVVLVPERKE